MGVLVIHYHFQLSFFPPGKNLLQTNSTGVLNSLNQITAHDITTLFPHLYLSSSELLPILMLHRTTKKIINSAQYAHLYKVTYLPKLKWNLFGINFSFFKLTKKNVDLYLCVQCIIIPLLIICHTCKMAIVSTTQPH